MKAHFLDFDGVIVDSVDECYMVSKAAYFEISKETDFYDDFKPLFYKYRGLVRPVEEFFYLYKAINLSLFIDQDIKRNFSKLVNDATSDEKSRYEHSFFSHRNKLQKNIKTWLSLHRLSEYGHSLQGKNDKKIYIVTTKDKLSVVTLLNHFDIKVVDIFDTKDYKNYGNKGVIIKNIINSSTSISSGVFIDDSVEHLDTLKHEHVECYFADWGYGDNTTYPIYHSHLWS
jgi:hypothetical protein